MRLLIVEDNRNLVANLFDYFEARGHIVDAAPDGLTGLHLVATQRYDAVVLDWSLPRLDGSQLLQRVRQDLKSAVPVVMLTVRNELPDKLAAFHAGADDYLTKPFALPELEARLDAVLARVHGREQPSVLQVHDLQLNLQTLEARRAGQLLHLYPACLRLLETLMRASPGAVARDRLEFALWGNEPPDGDILRSHVYDLRRRVDGPFEVKLIHTLQRVGYRIAVPESADHG